MGSATQAMSGAASAAQSAEQSMGGLASTSASAGQGLASTSSAAGGAGEGLASTSSAATAAGDALASAGAGAEAAGAGAEAAAAKHGALGGIMDLLQGKSAKAGEEFLKNAGKTEVFGVKVSELTSHMGLFGTSVEGAGSAAGVASSGGMGGLLSTITAINPATIAMVGGIALAVGAIVGLGAQAMAVGKQFHEWYGIIRVGTGATGEALEGLKSDFDAVFASSSASGEAIAHTMADLNTRTGATGPVLQGLTKQFMQLQKMGIDASVAGFTRALGDWSIPVEKAGQALDKLFVISQATGPSIEEIQGLVVRFGAPMRNFGFSFEESASMLALFQKQGVNTELVMGSLRIASGKFAREGVDLREGLNGAIEAIKNAGSSSEAAALAMETFGARAGADMADTIRGGKFEIQAFLDQMNQSPETIGRAAASISTYKGEFAKLGHQVTLAWEPVGEVVFDAVNKVGVGIAHMGSSVIEGIMPAATALGHGLGVVVDIAGTVASGLGSMLSVVLGVAQAAWMLVDGAAGIVGGWSNVIAIIAAAGATLAVFAAPVTLVVAAVGALSFGIGKAKESLAESRAELGPASTSMKAYAADVEQASQKHGGLGGAMLKLRDALASEGQGVVNNADAWLKFNAGASDAVLASDAMKAAHQALDGKMSSGAITAEEYQAALLNVASATSEAAGEGKLLSATQRAAADGMSQQLSGLALHVSGMSLAAQQSTAFTNEQKRLSEAFAQGQITADQAKQGIIDYSNALMTAAGSSSALEGPAADAQAAMADFSQTFGTNVAAILDAGSGLTLSEADRSEKMTKINEDLSTNVGGALQKLWETRKSFDEQFAEAREKDAKSQVSANATLQQNGDEHAAKMQALQDKLNGASGDKAAKIQAEIAEEQTKWNTLTSIASGGTDSAVAEVQRKYDEERATIRESLAQTVIDHLNSMAMMGQVSGETAKAIYGALATAYPGVEVINPATEATLEFNSTLNDVLTGEKDASAIVSAIDNVEQKMVESDNTNRDALGISEQTWSGIGDAAEAGSARIAGAAAGGSEAVDASTSDAVAKHAELAASHAELADTVEAQSNRQLASVSKVASNVGGSLNVVRNELHDTGASARSVGTDFDASFRGMGDKAATGVAGVGRALDDVKGKLAETGEMAEGVGSIQEQGFGAGADAAKQAASGIASSAQDISGGMASVTEESAKAQTGIEDLGAAAGELPTELKIPVTLPGATESIRTLERILHDLDQISSIDISVKTRHTPMDAATSPGGSFAIEHWLLDLYDTADSRGVSVRTDIDDHSNGLLSTQASGTGGLAWEAMLQALAAGDYAVIVSATLDLTEWTRKTAELHDKIERLTAEADAWGARLTSTWEQGLMPLLHEIDAADLPGFLSGLNLPEGVDTLDELIAHFRALKPEDQMDLWKRMFSDLKDIENERHREAVDNIKDEEQKRTDSMERITTKIEELRKKGEEDAKKPGADPFTDIDGLSDEITAANRQLLEILKQLDGTVVGADGLAFHITRESMALQDFYEAVTGGAREGIHSSEELLEAIKFLQDQAKEMAEKQQAAETERHERRMAAMEQLGAMSTRQFEDWKKANADLAATAKEQAELDKMYADARKRYEKDLRDAAKDRTDDEKAAHKLLIDHLAELKDAEKDKHDARLKALDAEKEHEDDDHKRRLDAIKTEGEHEREHLTELETTLGQMKLKQQKMQLAEGGLDEAKRILSELQRAIGNLPKENKRLRPGDRDKLTGKDVGLTDEAINAALATDKLSAAARRRLLLLQGGAHLSIAQLRSTLDEAEKALQGSAEQKNTELDRLKTEVGQQEYLIALEKQRLAEVDKRLKQETDDENLRHERELDNIKKRKDAEGAAWDAFQQRLEDAKKAEDKRHEAKLRQIEQELRAQLLASGLAAGDDPDEALKRAEAIAARFREILDKLIGDSTPSLLEPGAGSPIVAPPGGGGPIVLPPGGPGGPIAPPPGPSPYGQSFADMFAGEPAAGEFVKQLAVGLGKAASGPNGIDVSSPTFAQQAARGGIGVMFVNNGTIVEADALLKSTREGIAQSTGGMSGSRSGP